ncbi:MAG: sugar phosphate nucleotidyltransferase [bacterium]|nr:sugar phosphate nucleotidyltransferase [bacterium]
MKAVILAAGEGVRMRPLTENKPKPLLEVGGKTILEQIISRLPEEVDELILVVGYLGQQIIDFCEDEFLGRKVRYVWQERKLGTYNALKICEPHIEKGERFLMLFADDIHGGEGIEECLKYECALIVEETSEPWKFGIVQVNDDMSIIDIIEKPPRLPAGRENPSSNLASTGVLLLDTRIFDYEADLHPNGEYYLTSALSKMLKDGHKIFAVKSTMWLPIGYPEDIRKAEERLKDD